MSMTIDIRINGDLIAQIEAINETGGSEPDDVNTYRWTFQEGERRLADTIDHRYGDGAMVLVDRVTSAIGIRYRLANIAKRAGGIASLAAELASPIDESALPAPVREGNPT